MRCKDCGIHITWDNSFGKVEYLICEECWHSMVLDTDLPTAYNILMQKGTKSYENQRPTPCVQH